MTRWVMALSVVLASVGCASVDTRTVGQYVDDQATTAKVKLKLAGLHPSTLARINVDVYESTVYLMGPVPTQELKAKAEVVAASVDHVQLVVNNLHVTSPARTSHPIVQSTAELPRTPSAVVDAMPGAARFETDSPSGPFRAYDDADRAVATVHLIPMADLAQFGVNGLVTPSLPIDHVSIYSVDTGPDLPQPHYSVVLWHVSQREAALLLR